MVIGKTVWEMDVENISLSMEVSIMVTGKKTRKMDLEMKSLFTVKKKSFTKVDIDWDLSMATVYLDFRMGLFIKEISILTSYRVMEYARGLMIKVELINTVVSGVKTWCTVKEFSLFLIEDTTLGHLQEDSKMDLEFSHGQMDDVMLGHSKMINNMVKAFSSKK